MVVALLVFSLAVIISVSIADHQNFSIQKTARLLEQDQAVEYALGFERWAGILLEKDLNEGNIDHLGELWAAPRIDFPIELGSVSGQIKDLHACFNLNNLLDKQKPSAVHIKQFQTLLRLLGIENDITPQLVDWMDADDDPQLPDGVEELDYLLLDTPYRTANTPMWHPSELRTLMGMDEKTYTLLKPHICTLPESTKININTAPETIMMALSEGMTESQARALIEGRGEKGYQSFDEFKANPVWTAGLVLPSQTLVDVKSEYFLVETTALFGRSRAKLVSMLERKKDSHKVFYRNWGE